MIGIFDVENTHLSYLGPTEAVGFFRELILAEARRLEIPMRAINVSMMVNVPDGGIDAKVEGFSGTDDLIRNGQTAYQIKSGSAFRPTEGPLKKELFGSKPPNRENLADGIRKCLDANGAYVLVCVGKDLVDAERQSAIAILTGFLEECGYEKARVDVLSQNQLAAYLKRYPALCLRITHRDTGDFKSHRTWARQADMGNPFQPDAARGDRIKSIRSELRSSGQAVHIRISGEAGVGKTRLILEATRDPDLAPLTVYCESPSRFRDSSLRNAILYRNNQIAAVLVIDECDTRDATTLWNELENSGSGVKLITIYNETTAMSGRTKSVELPPLNEEGIVAIIEKYGIPRSETLRYAELCSGSPCVAHVIGQNLKSNPEDLTRPPDTVDIWNRFIVGPDNPSDPRTRQRMVTLKYLSLFKRFGFRKPHEKEAEAIAALISSADPQITRQRFGEIVRKLRDRRILQGETTLYISPKLLHVWLWKEWWETYGETVPIEELLERNPETLHRWLFEMFRYAEESQAASSVVEESLSSDRPFRQTGNGFLTTEVGAKRFQSLAEANPRSGLASLKRMIGSWNREKLLQFTTGRRQVVTALETIAVDKDLFCDAARLLLALGEAENESWSNNASRVFAELFSPGPGEVAPSEASPEKRFSVLEEALNADSEERRLLGIQACEHALEATHFHRRLGAEYRGIRPVPDRWKPATYGELFEAYRRVWSLLSKKTKEYEGEEQERAVEVLLSKSTGLTRYAYLAEMVTDTVKDLIGKPYANQREILAVASQVLSFSKDVLPTKARRGWAEIKERLAGTDFASQLKRYVGWALFERWYGEGSKNKERVLRGLARQAANEPSLLDAELSWLVTDEARCAVPFGFKLGEEDEKMTLLPRVSAAMTEAGVAASSGLLGGYLGAISRRDKDRWEQELDRIACDHQMRMHVPELTFYSSISDQAVLRIMKLWEKGVVHTNQLLGFGIPGNLERLSSGPVNQCIERLIRRKYGPAVAVALDTFHAYYVHEGERQLPRDLTMRLLRTTILAADDHTDDQMRAFYWGRVALKFARHHPKQSLELLRTALPVVSDSRLFASPSSEAYRALQTIAEIDPGKTWEIIMDLLETADYSLAFGILGWFRGGSVTQEAEEPLVSKIPQQRIWDWIDEDPQERAAVMAHFGAPKILHHEGRPPCFARELLVRYGDQESVRHALMANCSSGVYSGPTSTNLESRKRELREFLEDEQEENVRRWVKEYVDRIEKEIRASRQSEEREDF